MVSSVVLAGLDVQAAQTRAALLEAVTGNQRTGHRRLGPTNPLPIDGIPP